MCFFVVAAIVLPLAAPTFAAGKIGFGGKAGLAISKITGDDADGLDSRTGFALGGYLEFPIAPTVAFRPEAMYIQKGAKEDLSGVDMTFKLDYIEVPLLLVVKIPTETGSVTPEFFAGPAIGMNVTAKVTGEYEGESESIDIDNAKSMDLGVTVGGGAAFKVGEANKLTIDVRYTLGLTKLFDDVDDPGEGDLVNDDGSTPDVKNGSIVVLVGFGI
jgi:hypothetical protein